MAVNLLSQKAVVTDVHIRHWTGRKLDHRITDETNERHKAEADAGRYNKLLISANAFTELYQLASGSRRKHFLMTMPWSDAGFRILPTAMYDEFANTFRQLRDDYNVAADKFDKAYPNYVGAAKKRLGSMFNPDDYPDPSRVRAMFSFKVSVRPCPDVADFRVSLADEHAEDIRANLKAEMEAVLEDAMKEPIRRIITVVDKMATKLKDYKPKTEAKRAENTFRDSLVDNIRELLPLLGAFNLTGDKAITALTARVEKELCKNDADTLREDEKVRKLVAKSAEDILKQANALMA